MLSRRHIRVKVMQALYMYHNDGDDKKSLPHLTRALERNIAKVYELYLYLLLFVEEMGRYVSQYEEQVRARYVQNEKELKNSTRLYENHIIQQLIHNETFHKVLEKHHIHWQGDEDLLRKIFQDLKNQDIYNEYVQFAGSNPVLEQEVLIFMLKHYTTHFPMLQQHLEEMFFNWQDDKKIILQLAAKTIQGIAASPGEDFLLPLSDNEEENIEFGRTLLRSTIEQDERLTKIIEARITKWEPHMVAVIDIIILRMAICEFLSFPSIPSRVTINEYIEMSKTYSTPQSKKFINGVLDAVFKDLKKEGVVVKS